jgi:hypothetical protein
MGEARHYWLAISIIDQVVTTSRLSWLDSYPGAPMMSAGAGISVGKLKFMAARQRAQAAERPRAQLAPLRTLAEA